VTRLDEQLRSDPTAFYLGEAARMARVQKNFVIIEYIELFIIVVTAAAAVSLKARPGLAGVALGLLISGPFFSPSMFRGAQRCRVPFSNCKG
jgi:hypothetical protein